MTGFGAASRGFDTPQGSMRLDIELRSVNGRFLEVRVRQPFGPHAEQAIRKQVDQHVGRGRVEVGIFVRRHSAEVAATDPLQGFGVNPDELRAALAAVGEVEAAAARGKLSLHTCNAIELLRFVAAQRQAHSDTTPEAPAFMEAVVGEALVGLCTLRKTEGAALEAVLLELAASLERVVETLAATVPGESERLAQKLTARATELCAGLEGEPPNPDRVAAEIALLVAKGDVTEELDRIASHLQQVRGTLAQDASSGQGKTLDFLTQELFREVNTIGSKITSHAGSRGVIEAKAIIERLREQVQNVE